MQAKKQVFIFFLLFFALLRAGEGGAKALLPEALSQARAVSPLKSISNNTKTIPVGLHITLKKGWHSYWKYPGETGRPFKIQWTHPAGVKVSSLGWPSPLRLVSSSIVSFIYQDEFFLTQYLTLPSASTHKSKHLTLKARAEWLICKTLCIPIEQNLTLRLPVKNKAEPHPLHTRLFNSRLSQMPPSARLLLSTQPALEPAPAQPKGVNIFWILLSAFLGGLILNFMPCVLPIVFLKLSHTIEQAPQIKAGRGGLRAAAVSNIAYSLGVTLAFLFLGGVIIFLKKGGELIGWGFQMQSPYFLAGLILLFMLLSFNFMGWVHVVLPRPLRLKVFHPPERPGRVVPIKEFLTGVLSTTAASPCTAPFMGAALGYGLTGSAGDTLLVFMLLGLGLSSPLLLLSVFPKMFKLLPLPGAWNENLKTFMAFPMLGTAAWLISLLNQHAPHILLPFLLNLVLLSAGFWLACYAAKGLWLWRIVIVMCLLLPFWLLQSAQLLAEGGKVQKDFAPAGGGKQQKEKLNWEVFSIQKLEALRAQNKAVLVNFSASWCLTCLFNENTAFKNKKVIQLINNRPIYLLKGDWTHKNPQITQVLNQWGRHGIPFYLYFPGAGGQNQAQVLPAILTPSILLKELQNL